MIQIKIKKALSLCIKTILMVTLNISAGYGQLLEYGGKADKTANNQRNGSKNNTTFPQIHTNLNGMVREFVRSMYQDTKGNYWFGTNGNGIIRYDGKTLETIKIEGIHPYMRVMKIIEDKTGNVWFGTSEGLIKYDGIKYKSFSLKEGLPGNDAEIWALKIDKNEQFWVGSIGGVSHFDGEKFIPFLIPDLIVENRQHMLSEKLVFNIWEAKSGTIWIATDGNGVFKYKKGEFIHLTNKNGLTDNNTTGVLEDKQGNVWISTFYGGVSKYNGITFTNFTKDGLIKGEEAGGLLQDKKGNIWFSAENIGVYKYDGINFTLYTTENGLTSNLVLQIYEDTKGQLWFTTWQGLCIFDGEKFVNASIKEPWTN